MDFIQRETAHAFFYAVRDQELKQHIFLGGDRSLSEALNRALIPEAAQAASWPTARPRTAKRPRDGRPVSWQCENAGRLSRDSAKTDEKVDKDSGDV
jgi:hypothetical protein